MSAARWNFGRRLRDHRERHQITLDAIATTTKIRPSLLAELERGDVSTWPSGIFRRAFVRAYATAIGLPPESLVEEFVQLFPEPDAVDSMAAPTPTPTPTSDLRLTLAVEPRQLLAAILTRAIAALLEAGLIVTVAGLTAWISATSFWTACATIALVYYALAAACTRRSLASLDLQGTLHSLWPPRPDLRSPSPHTREPIYLVQHPRDRPAEPIQEDPVSAASTPRLRAASR